MGADKIRVFIEELDSGLDKYGRATRGDRISKQLLAIARACVEDIFGNDHPGCDCYICPHCREGRSKVSEALMALVKE